MRQARGEELEEQAMAEASLKQPWQQKPNERLSYGEEMKRKMMMGLSSGESDDPRLRGLGGMVQDDA